jgi:poly(3-hydroxybutyrate) depolymerase
VVALAQTPARQPKPLPPPGIEISAQDRAELQAGLDHLRAEIAKLKTNPLVPDVLIYSEAVRFALDYNEFFNANEVAKARTLLQHGEERARQLADGHPAWTTATGLVVRGYISKIDQSVQPYGLVVPPSYSPNAPHRWRLDTWFHGRNETLTQVNFLADRERNVGEFAPRDTIVLHLYGRYCNASKFAGEVDLFEALDSVKRQYAIDENRILDRGFSMGGATAWHIGTHYAGLWAAVAPGAGFSESEQYLKLKLTGPDAVPEWEQKLFHLYDATDYAANLFNTSTIAYNGEIDPQKQAADMMEHALAEEGLRLIRIVGPQTAHKYHPDSKIELARMLDAVAAQGRNPYPRKIRFTTWTLAYNQMKWVTVDGLEHHWSRARVNAEIGGDSAVNVETSGVTAFTLDFGPGGCPLDLARKVALTIDGDKLSAAGPMSDRSWQAHFAKANGRWSEVSSTESAGLHKVHGLQGPIDDAFFDRFVFVSPTGTPAAPAVAPWVASEEKRAIAEWRRQFRGDAQVRDDKDITDADIASSNLILWGDPGSNRILARIADKLPMKWPTSGAQALIMIYPNPLNPKKYVVLNSGFTFRETDYASNAMQTPKLPDFAVVDTAAPAGGKWPGKVLKAGFFNEAWQ